MEKQNNSPLSWVIAIVGGLIIILLFLILGELKGTDKPESKEESSTEEESTTTKQNWDVNVKEWNLKTESGEDITFYTPDGYYSLADQYLDSLKSYYKADDVKSDSMVVVGDAVSSYESKTLINANTLSDTLKMLQQLYGEDFKADEMVDSEAYTYMKTGKLPEELPLNYEIKELETYKVNGVKYVAYEVNYDTEYEVEPEEDPNESDVDENTGTAADGKDAADKDEEKKEVTPQKEVVHTQQISCYSDTEDAVEIIIYQAEFDKDVALMALEAFLGVGR